MTLVKFYKTSYDGSETLPIVFTHESDDFNAAYEEAVRRGHNPTKRIEMKHVDSYSPFNTF